MKRMSRAALIFSGTAFVAGAAVGIAPFLDATFQRISNRTDIAEAGMMVSDFATSQLGGGPRMMSPMPLRNADNASGLSAPTSPAAVMTTPALPDPSSIRFSAINLNQLNGGKGFEPMAINNRGEIVGNYRSVEPVEYTVRSMDGRRIPSRYRATSRPAVFRDGKFESLPPAPDCTWTFATGINDQGVVVGAARPLKDLSPLRLTTADLPLLRILRWDKGVSQDLSETFYQLPEMENDVRKSRFSLVTGDPVFINNDGTIFVGAGSLYRWRQGTVTRFDTGIVRQINEHGIMVGLVSNPNRSSLKSDPTLPPGVTPAFAGGGLQPGILNTETGQKTALGRFSDIPCAINDAGTIILSGNRSGNLSQVSLWKNGKAEKLANLASTMTCYINNQGWVAVGDGMRDWPRNNRGLNSLYGPFLWDGKRFYNLQSLVSNLKGEWAFAQVVGLNDHSQILVYAFEVGKPQRHAFLLTPVRS